MSALSRLSFTFLTAPLGLLILGAKNQRTNLLIARERPRIRQLLSHREVTIRHTISLHTSQGKGEIERGIASQNLLHLQVLDQPRLTVPDRNSSNRLGEPSLALELKRLFL